MNKDMTVGAPAKVLFYFTLPLLLSATFQQMYNMTDSLIVGRYVGETALAAVGASYPVVMIFIAVAQGCNIGCSVVVSQLFGAKQMAQLKTAVSTATLSVRLGFMIRAIGTENSLCKTPKKQANFIAVLPYIFRNCCAII